jgi:microcystin-dependent protein
MPVYRWSQTASDNGNSDPTVNFLEGQTPGSLNDSGRAMIAALRKYVDDISGAIVTGGTATSYTVASYSAFDNLAHMSGTMIAFTPHATNGATVTLNVDGLGAKPLRSAPSTELLAGTLIAGTPYIALYNNSDAAFYLHGFYGQAYNVPLLGGLDYWDSVTPNSSFIFPAGQAISRTTYPAAFARWGTTFGAGDGSTTFNVPDKTGRVSVMKEATATRLTTAVSGVDGATMGAAGGTQSKTLVTANLPAYTPGGTISNGAISISHNAIAGSSTTGGGQFACGGNSGASISASQGTSTFTGTAQGGTSTAFAIVPPTIVCNYIIRII